MTALAKIEKDKVRARHHSWDDPVEAEPFFRHIITLDPEIANESWGKLAVNTPMIEFRGMQRRLHVSLMSALKTFKPHRT